jgi:acetyl esterase/lipase
MTGPICGGWPGRWLLTSLLCALPVCGCYAPPWEVPEIQTERGVIYRVSAGEELAYDLYTPVDKSPQGLVVLVHGGAWVSDEPDFGAIGAWGVHFAHRGYAAVNVHYRLAPAHPLPAAYLDVVAALRAARVQYEARFGVAPRCAILGNSAGGHLALLAGLNSDPERFGDAGDPNVPAAVDGVVAFAGPTDLVALDQFFEQYSIFPDGWNPLNDAVAGPQDDWETILLGLSPLTYVGTDDCPVLLVQGDIDRIVPPAQSERLFDALTAVGNTAVMLLVKGLVHGVYLDMHYPQVRWRVLPSVDSFVASVLSAPAPPEGRRVPATARPLR